MWRELAARTAEPGLPWFSRSTEYGAAFRQPPAHTHSGSASMRASVQSPLSTSCHVFNLYNKSDVSTPLLDCVLGGAPETLIVPAALLQSTPSISEIFRILGHLGFQRSQGETDRHHPTVGRNAMRSGGTVPLVMSLHHNDNFSHVTILKWLVTADIFLL